MTAHYIATLVQKTLDNIDNEENGILNFCRAKSLLEDYATQNFLTFEQTELVYTHARRICEKRNMFENWYRGSGFGYGTKEQAAVHKGIAKQHTIKGITKFRFFV
jgi:hypothetical protein